jgi:hypothetical protein
MNGTNWGNNGGARREGLMASAILNKQMPGRTRAPSTYGLSEDEMTVEEPPSATGQYPDAVWAGGGDASGQSASLEASDADVEEPPSATGQYPDAVWAESSEAASLNNGAASLSSEVDGEARRNNGASSARGQAASDFPLFLKESDYAHEVGDAPDAESADTQTEASASLNNQEIYRIVREVALADSGAELYAAVSADSEFTTPGQDAYQRRHFGLAFGLLLFTQESGHLGSVLRLMQQRDASAFNDIFGAQAEALLQVTNAARPEDRLQPVGDEPLWSPVWVERFRRAGGVAAFQAAQNEEAIEGQFRPMLNVAFALGLTTDRGLAMAYDRVVTRGLGGGLRWLVKAAGPLRTSAQREHALSMLGFRDVTQFQQAVGWIQPNGLFGPETHAALVGALRQQGRATLPTADQLMARLVAQATGPARARLLRLRDSAALTDVAYAQQTAPARRG